MSDVYMTLLPKDLQPGQMPQRESTWRDTHLGRVHVERVGPRESRRRVLFFHGAGGNAAMLWPFAAAIAEQGVHVIVPDFYGFGKSTVRDKASVRYSHWVSLAAELLQEERSSQEGPLVAVGGSMGGMIAYDAATRTGAADTVVATCLLDPRDRAARRQIAALPLLGQVAPVLMRVLAGPFARVPVPMRWLANMRAISNDPNYVRAALADKQGGGNSMPLGFLRSYLESAPAIEPEDAEIPVVLAQPDADPWTPLETSRPFLERLGSPTRLVTLHNAGHVPIEAPGARQLIEVIIDALDGSSLR